MKSNRAVGGLTKCLRYETKNMFPYNKFYSKTWTGLVLGHLQTVQTQIRRRRTRRLIWVCAVCLNYTNETALRPCSGPFSTLIQRQSTGLPVLSVLWLEYTCIIREHGVQHGFVKVKQNVFPIRAISFLLMRTCFQKGGKNNLTHNNCSILFIFLTPNRLYRNQRIRRSGCIDLLPYLHSIRTNGHKQKPRPNCLFDRRLQCLLLRRYILHRLLVIVKVIYWALSCDKYGNIKIAKNCLFCCSFKYEMQYLSIYLSACLSVSLYLSGTSVQPSLYAP